MKEEYIKIWVGLSIVALILVSIFYFRNNNTFMFVSSISANIIQILMFLAWYFQNNPITERTVTQIDKIYEYTQNREERFKYKERIIRKLIDEGLVLGYDIKKIFSSLKNREVLLVHTYGEGVPSGLLKAYNSDTQPLISVLTKSGFVRVFGKHNLFMIFKKNLPRKLRRLETLERFITQELEKIWNQIETYANKEYPSSKYKIYEKYRTKEGFKCSYLVFKVLEDDFIIGYKNRYAFTPQFENSIMREVELSKLKPLIPNKVKLQQFVNKTSIEILLGDIPENIKKEILKHEKDIKNNLKINKFTDFKDVSIEFMSNELRNILKTEEGLDSYSESIKNHASEFYSVLKELGADSEKV